MSSRATSPYKNPRFPSEIINYATDHARHVLKQLPDLVTRSRDLDALGELHAAYL